MRDRAVRLDCFLRSRLPALVLWNGGLALAAAVLVLAPDKAWPLREALYALLLNLIAQLVWLLLEARSRERLARRLALDVWDDASPAEPGLTDQDLLLAELARLRERMEASLRQEREKQQAYGDYLVGWVHELKTPLTALRLGLDAQGAAEARMTNGSMQDELRSLELLVDQALFYARSESFALDYLVKPLHLPSLVRQLLANNARRCIQRRLQPCFGPGFRVAESAPENAIESLAERAGPDWRVLSDPVWLGFILQQVLSNALKYAPQGSKLFFDLERIDGQIVLHIDDQGPGVPPEEWELIFNRGFTGQSRDRAGGKADSTGMGLYLARRLAQRLGHHVRASWPPQAVEEPPEHTAATSPPGPGLRISIAFRA